MSAEIEPRLATDEDYPEIVGLLDRVFGYNSGGMSEQIPNWFDESQPERYAVVERDGQIVSTVGRVPQTFVIGGDEIEIWGVGNVATDPHHRGNGYMSTLLEFWLERLSETDVPLAELGGDTKRYNRFGWENAGREYTYTVTQRSFPETAVDIESVRTYEGTSADLDLLIDVHRTEEYRVKRTRSEFRDLFEQRGLETLLYTGEHGDAYLSINQEVPSGRYSTSDHRRVVPEFGGSEKGLEAAFCYLWDHYGVSRVGVPVHPTHDRNQFFRQASSTWSLESHRMVRISDLASVLQGFAGQMTRRWQATPHSGKRNGKREGEKELTIDIEESASPPVTIQYSNSSVSVEKTPSRDPDVSLDRLAVTQLLFGFSNTYSSIKDNYPFLTAVLPLDFYIWHIEGP